MIAAARGYDATVHDVAPGGVDRSPTQYSGYLQTAESSKKNAIVTNVTKTHPEGIRR